MKEETKMGMNKTGIQMSPIMSKQMQEASDSLPETIPPDDDPIMATRIAYIKESSPMGSVPIPGTIKGMGTAGMQILKGNRPQAFIDKLGERLAFERSGVRLYDAFITKCEASDIADELPLDQLKRIRAEEAGHFQLLTKTMETLGADPTAVTPCADVSAVASSGIVQVLTDPRTSVAQATHAVLIAELTDNDGWDLLIEMAEKAGLNEPLEEFKLARTHELEHLQIIRQLLKDLSFRDETLIH